MFTTETRRRQRDQVLVGRHAALPPPNPSLCPGAGARATRGGSTPLQAHESGNRTRVSRAERKNPETTPSLAAQQAAGRKATRGHRPQASTARRKYPASLTGQKDAHHGGTETRRIQEMNPWLKGVATTCTRIPTPKRRHTFRKFRGSTPPRPPEVRLLEHLEAESGLPPYGGGPHNNLFTYAGETAVLRHPKHEIGHRP